MFSLIFSWILICRWLQFDAPFLEIDGFFSGDMLLRISIDVQSDPCVRLDRVCVNLVAYIVNPDPTYFPEIDYL